MSKKNLIIAIIFVLLSLLSLFVPLSCSAAPVYTMTEAELAQLETNLKKLETINQQSQAELMTLKIQLTESREALAKAKQQSEMLTQQLATLKTNSEKQEALLQTANESLKQYETEMKEKQNNLKLQRNIAYAVIAFFIYREMK